MSRMTKAQYELIGKLDSLHILHSGFTYYGVRQTLPKGLIIKHDHAVSHDSLMALLAHFYVILMSDGRLFIE